LAHQPVLRDAAGGDVAARLSGAAGNAGCGPIQDYRGTISADRISRTKLCVKRIDDARIEGLRPEFLAPSRPTAPSGRPRTLRRFAERFRPLRLPFEAMTPVYGLAESTVGLLSPPWASAAHRPGAPRAFQRRAGPKPAADDERRCAALRLLRQAAARA